VASDRSSPQLPVSPLLPPAPAKRRAMQAQRERDTRPEVDLRRELHRRGLRFFVHRRPVQGLRREADIVFVRARLAIFVDGCFWHSCPQHGSMPRANETWWRDKLDRNRARDADTQRRFEEAGWSVLRVWEHELTAEAADRVEAAVRDSIARQATASSSPPGRVRGK